MRNLLELTEVTKSDLPSIYCDMDKVLVAFMKGADDAVGGDGFARMKDKNKRWEIINTQLAQPDLSRSRLDQDPSAHPVASSLRPPRSKGAVVESLADGGDDWNLCRTAADWVPAR